MAKKKVASKSKPKPVNAKKAASKSKPAKSGAKTSGKKSAPAKKKAVKAAKTPTPVKPAKKTPKPVAAAKRKSPAKNAPKKAKSAAVLTKDVKATKATQKRKAATKAAPLQRRDVAAAPASPAVLAVNIPHTGRVTDIVDVPGNPHGIISPDVDPLDGKRRRRSAAYALAERDADAGGTALERAEDKLAVDGAVKTCPVEPGDRLENQCGGIGHVGDGIGLARDQPLERGREVAVEGWLVGGVEGEVVH